MTLKQILEKYEVHTEEITTGILFSDLYYICKDLNPKRKVTDDDILEMSAEVTDSGFKIIY